MIKECIKKLANLKNLSAHETEAVFNEVTCGAATPSQIAAFLTALAIKGETSEEIAAAAKVMRKKSLKINCGVKPKTLLDTCGTGGSGINAFNISTCSAFVIAGCGVKVAKHGNRSSSGCGSADVLEALGVNLAMPRQKVEESIKKIGIGFMFAPLFHSSMKYASGVRKEIGIRTIFNILGPLTNPAGANTQVLGVCKKELVNKLCEVLKKLGVKRAFVVHGSDLLDEITITGPTYIAELKNNRISRFTVTPADFGFKKASNASIMGGDAGKNASIILKILKGEESPRRNIVLMNASCALVASGIAKNFKDGVRIASESIDSGAALNKLRQLIKLGKEGEKK